MNNEKIAPKVFTYLDNQIKDPNIPFYIANIIKTLNETVHQKDLENTLKNYIGYSEHDDKLKKIFLNLGWEEKYKKFSKEINKKQLNEIINKEYQINNANKQTENNTECYQSCFDIIELNSAKIENNKNFELLNNYQQEINKINNFNNNELFLIKAENKESKICQINFENKNISDNIIYQMTDQSSCFNNIELNKSFVSNQHSKNKEESNQNDQLTSSLFLREENRIGENSKKEEKEKEKDLNTKNLNEYNNQSLILSATKSHKNLMFSNKKNLSICDNEFDEDSASIKKPIATTVSSNSYPLDYSKIISLQNEQNKNALFINCISNNINNDDNLKMPSLLVNSNSLINNNKNYHINSPNPNFNKLLNNNSAINNNFLAENSNIQNEIQKIITPKFNKIIKTTINNPLNNLIPNPNFISNNINNNILININNPGVPIDTNSLPINSNQHINSFLFPNSPTTMNFNSNIFTKSNFTKNPSSFSSHASPGNNLGYNASSAFNPNIANFKGVPLNSPHSVKSLDSNLQNSINNHNQNLYCIKNANNQNSINNSHFHPATEELRKISVGNAGSNYSNKITHNNLPMIKSKNLCFLEKEENESFINNKILINKTNSSNNNFRKNSNIKNNNYNDNKINQINKLFEEENNLLNSKLNNNISKINNVNKKKYSMNKNNDINNNNNFQEMNYEKKNLTSKKKLNEENKEQENLNKNETDSNKENSYFNPNVILIKNEKSNLSLIINKNALIEQADIFNFPILEKLTNNSNNFNSTSIEPSNLTAEGRRPKRLIQRNKKFFNEEHYHYGNSFGKIVTPKNIHSSLNKRNYIDNSFKNSNDSNNNQMNLIKRKRKKTKSKLSVRSNIKYESFNDSNTNELNFYEFNFRKRKFKKGNNYKTKQEDLNDKESLAAKSEEDNLSSIELNNSDKASKLLNVKSNKIYKSGNTNSNENLQKCKNSINKAVDASKYMRGNIKNFNNYIFKKKSISELNLKTSTNCNNYPKDYYTSMQHQQQKNQVGRRRRKRKNNKYSLSESKKVSQFNKKRFLNSRNTSYGLKEISKNVLKIVKKYKSTTYKEISDMIVSDINADLNGSKDEKNIRRRIYDSLNVMKAMNIFKKEKNLKNIVFNNSSQNAFLLSMLEKDDSDSAFSARNGILLRNSVQPLKHSFFGEGYNFQHLSSCNNNNYINDYYDFSNNRGFDNRNFSLNDNKNVYNLNNSNRNSNLENDKTNINQHFKENVVVNKDNSNINQNYFIEKNTDSTEFNSINHFKKENEMIISNEDKATENKSIMYNLEIENQQMKNEIKIIKDEQDQKNKLIQQNLLHRKLSNESNFRPAASEGKTNINNNININIYNNFVKNDLTPNPIYLEKNIKPTNLGIPGIDSCFNVFPNGYTSNVYLINPSINYNRHNNLNFKLIQNNSNYSQHHNIKEKIDDAIFSNENKGFKSKKQIIENLKNLLVIKIILA